MKITDENILPLMNNYAMLSHERDLTISELRKSHNLIESRITREFQEYGLEMKRIHASRVRCKKLVREEGFFQTPLISANEIWDDILRTLEQLNNKSHISSYRTMYEELKDPLIAYLMMHAEHRKEIRTIRASFNTRKMSVYQEILLYGIAPSVINACQKQINVELKIRKVASPGAPRDELRSNILEAAMYIADNIAKGFH